MGDTALIRMTIAELAKLREIPIAQAFNLFYTSELFRDLANHETGLFTYTPRSLAEMV